MSEKNRLVEVDAEEAIKSLKKLHETTTENTVKDVIEGSKIYVTPQLADTLHKLFVKTEGLREMSAIWPPIKK